MLSYCLKCKKNTKSMNQVVSKTKSGRTMILSKWAICGIKKSKCIKEQEAKGLLTSISFKTGLENIPFFGEYLL